MNKAAIAMAADSAVTISSGRRGVKIFQSMNKLFELVHGSSVGAMIYGNAELNGLPWESAMKYYKRSRRGFQGSSVEEYVNDFCGYLADPANVLAASTDKATVLNIVYGKLIALVDYVERERSRWESGSGRPIKSRLRQVLAEAVDLLEALLIKADEAPWFPELAKDKLQRQYGSVIAELIDEMFSELEMTPSMKKKIVSLGIESIVRSTPENSDTGLVVAGITGTSPLPKMYEVTIRGRIDGVLRLAEADWTEITVDNPSYFSTFAQDEEGAGFVYGITSDVRNAVMDYWNSWHQEFGEDVVECVKKIAPKMDARQIKRVNEKVTELAHAKFHEFLAIMQRRQEELYIQPMLDSVAMLPKDELGVLAESLVSVTSLKQHMSIFDAETVGGPIDVALISPGDGFVWLKRKHYFTAELNPAWHLTHYANVEGGGDANAQAK